MARKFGRLNPLKNSCLLIQLYNHCKLCKHCKQFTSILKRDATSTSGGILVLKVLLLLLYFPDALFPKYAGVGFSTNPEGCFPKELYHKAHDFAMLVLKVRLAEKLQNCLKQEKVV